MTRDEYELGVAALFDDAKAKATKLAAEDGRVEVFVYVRKDDLASHPETWGSGPPVILGNVLVRLCQDAAHRGDDESCERCAEMLFEMVKLGAKFAAFVAQWEKKSYQGHGRLH